MKEIMKKLGNLIYNIYIIIFTKRKFIIESRIEKVNFREITPLEREKFLKILRGRYLLLTQEVVN